MDKQITDKQRLLWVIDFINQNIDDLGTGDFLKLLVEMKDRIRGLPFMILGKKEEFPKVHKSSLPKEYVFIDDMPKTRELVKSVQTEIKELFEVIYKKSQRMKTKPRVYTNEFERDISYVITVGPGHIYVGPDLNIYGLKFEIGKLIYDSSPPGEGKYRTLKIKKCQAPKRKGICGKFFVEIHLKKEKNYCSNQCAWRAYSKWAREDEKKSREEQKKKKGG